MATRIYGRSDDLIEFEGDVTGEANYQSGDDHQATLIVCSDGTVLAVRYGKLGLGIWHIMALQYGPLYEAIIPCNSEDANPPSDVVIVNDGLMWAYVAHQCTKVR
jgi:hypothetical protein